MSGFLWLAAVLLLQAISWFFDFLSQHIGMIVIWFAALLAIGRMETRREQKELQKQAEDHARRMRLHDAAMEERRAAEAAWERAGREERTAQELVEAGEKAKLEACWAFRSAVGDWLEARAGFRACMLELESARHDELCELIPGALADGGNLMGENARARRLEATSGARAAALVLGSAERALASAAARVADDRARLAIVASRLSDAQQAVKETGARMDTACERTEFALKGFPFALL